MKLNSEILSNAAFAGDSRGASVPSFARPRAVSLALLLLRCYKLLISPIFAGSCRFVPSCADYAAESIATHGLRTGTWLALKRLGRCHPLCAGGYDPIPPRN